MTRGGGASDRICLALDFPGAEEAVAFAKRFEGKARWFKVGLELFVAEGPSVVSLVAPYGEVFLDLKLHDIPNTVARAVGSAVRSGASMVNVHASGGRAMMAAAQEAAAAEASRAGIAAPAVIAVTLLTSLDESSMHGLPFRGQPLEIVAELARLAAEAGLDGVVCAAGDLEVVRRECGAAFLTVVPGIRPASSEVGDQKRIATPAAAIAAGASLLVVGRPVTQAADPENALHAIAMEIEAAGR
ncbi:MAG: orotidine-5'-phosphate decarboxylase [Thermoanaerobaculia bacterium]